MLPEQLPTARSEESPVQPVRWRRVLLVLLAVSAALVAVSLLLPRRLFSYVGDEANLPTWWTVALLLGAALLHAQAGVLAHRNRTPGATAWPVLALLLTLLSLDELTQIHERLDRWGRALIDDGLAFPWLLLGVPIATGAIVVAVFSARHLPRLSTLLSVGGIGLLLLSAVGLEAVGGLFLGDRQGALRGTEVGYILVMHLEEFGEMAGAAVAACGPLAALRTRRTGTDLGLSLADR